MASQPTISEINKIEKSLEKISSLISELLSRIAVIEIKLITLENETKEINQVIENTKKSINELDKSISSMNTKNEWLSEVMENVKNRMDSKFISKDQFEPIKKIVYAISGSMILGVIGAIMNLVIKKS